MSTTISRGRMSDANGAVQVGTGAATSAMQRRRRTRTAAPLSASASAAATPLLHPLPPAAIAAASGPLVTMAPAMPSHRGGSTLSHASIKHFHIDPLAAAGPSVPAARHHDGDGHTNGSSDAWASASGGAATARMPQHLAQQWCGPHTARAMAHPQPVAQRRLRGAPPWQSRAQQTHSHVHAQARNQRDTAVVKSRPPPPQLQAHQAQSGASPFLQRNRAQAQRQLEQHAEEQMERLFGLLPSQLQHPPPKQTSAVTSIAPTPRRTLSPQRSRASLYTGAVIDVSGRSNAPAHHAHARTYPLLEALQPHSSHSHSPRYLTIDQAMVPSPHSLIVLAPIHAAGAAHTHPPPLDIASSHVEQHTEQRDQLNPIGKQQLSPNDSDSSSSPAAQQDDQPHPQAKRPPALLDPDPMWGESNDESSSSGSGSATSSSSPPVTATTTATAAARPASFVASSPRAAQLHALWTEQYEALKNGASTHVEVVDETPSPVALAAAPLATRASADDSAVSAPVPASPPPPPEQPIPPSPRVLHERAPAQSSLQSSPTLHGISSAKQAENGGGGPPPLARPPSLARSTSLARSDSFARSASVRSLHGASGAGISDAAALQAAQAKFASVNALLDSALESARSSLHGAPGVSSSPTSAANRTRSFKQLHAAPPDGRPTGGRDSLSSFSPLGGLLNGGGSGSNGSLSRTSSGLHLRRPSTSLSASVVEDEVATALSFSIAERLEENRSAVDPAFRRRMQQQGARAQAGAGGSAAGGSGSGLAHPQLELAHWALHVHEQIVAERKAAAAEAERLAEQRKKEEAAESRPPPPARSASIMLSHAATDSPVQS